jgi:general secretion pathway protein O
MRRSKKPIHLWSIERKFVPFSEIGFGPLAGKKNLSLLFILGCFIISVIGLYSQQTADVYNIFTTELCIKLIAILIALRLILVDLRHLLLPDIYTIPLIVLGCFYNLAFTEHVWWLSFAYAFGAIAFLLLFSRLMDYVSNGKSFLGGGDIKMIAAIAAWESTSAMPLIITLACFITFLMLPLIKNNKNIPFGPGLCFAFIIQIINPNWWHIFF